MRKFMVALWLTLALASVSQGQTFEVFSYQLPEGGPRHAHSWAVWEHAGEKVCISWGPIGHVRVLGRAEQGSNSTHAQALAYAKFFGAEVRSLGPYPCSVHTFNRAKAQKLRLEAGFVAYKATAVNFGSDRANCYMACAMVGRGTFTGGFSYGHEASRRLALHLLASDF